MRGITLLLALAVAGPRESAATDEAHVGRVIDDFRLQDHLGVWYRLAEFQDRPLVVVAFLGTECPLAKLYGGRLAELDAKFKARGVVFLGIDSNQQDTPTELAYYARVHQLEFPLLKDPGNQVADRFRAERTPEVFVLDQQRRIRYWGRIDDQFGVGYARPNASQPYLELAIQELLAGQPVSNPEQESVGCRISRVVRRPAQGDITYGQQISRILQQRCTSCHREGGIAPFALTSYNDAAAWAETALEVIDDGRMPPWHADPAHGRFSNDVRMPDQEKRLLRQWVRNGLPEGRVEDLPPPQQYVQGWRIGQPDVVLSLPTSFSVPARGVVPYQYFTVDPGLAEGKWVKASEARPGDVSVVHHIIVFVQPPGGEAIIEEQGVGIETIGSYVPGAPPMQLEDGVARYVPAGSKFVFQMHYTPNGKPTTDRSELGLVFADPASVRHTMQSGVAANLDFKIPPHASDHPVHSHYRFSHDMLLYQLAPHMHFRGKSFRYEAVYPGGSREILLDVPRYDFNWQNSYRFAQPKLMPEGTILRCTAHFDNSADNLSNPDPSVAVKWGEQTWDEMMIGFFEGIYLNQDMSLPGLRMEATDDGRFDVRFSYRPDRPVRTVHVAGTFNEWSNSKDPMQGPDENGFYHGTVRLAAGDYRYKFVLDGNFWTHDPSSKQLTGFLHESYFVAGGESQR